jgi:hypothetical protein
MAVSPMHFGFTCDDGWFLLLDGHLAALQAMADEGRIPQPVASQVKQKYGQLRLYLKNPTTETLALAESLRLTSAITCEKCGAPGLLRWYAGVKTLCDAHAPFGTPVVWPQPPLETGDAR